MSGGGGGEGGGIDTPTYLSIALNAGLTIADLERLPMGWVLDIAMIRSGDYADTVEATDATTSDLLGGI